MTREEAQQLIYEKDFSNYSFEYLDGYVDGIDSIDFYRDYIINQMSFIISNKEEFEKCKTLINKAISYKDKQ